MSRSGWRNSRYRGNTQILPIGSGLRRADNGRFDLALIRLLFKAPEKHATERTSIIGRTNSTPDPSTSGMFRGPTIVRGGPVDHWRAAFRVGPSDKLEDNAIWSLPGEYRRSVFGRMDSHWVFRFGPKIPIKSALQPVIDSSPSQPGIRTRALSSLIPEARLTFRLIPIKYVFHTNWIDHDARAIA